MSSESLDRNGGDDVDEKEKDHGETKEDVFGSAMEDFFGGRRRRHRQIKKRSFLSDFLIYSSSYDYRSLFVLTYFSASCPLSLMFFYVVVRSPSVRVFYVEAVALHVPVASWLCSGVVAVAAGAE